MRFIDMFCGIGGFRLGLERAGNLGESRRQRDSEIQKEQSDFATEETGRYFRCVWSNDNDKWACQIYRQRFEEGVEKPHEGEHQTKNTRCQRSVDLRWNRWQASHNGKWDERSKLYEADIRTVDADAIPEHDLLCAGFPCQSFSIAGKRRGFEDTRGTLFFEICRVLRAKRPGMFLLENVKGLLSADEGRTFQTILESLDELGYDCQWQVLNSKNYGVPQNRERVFIIGHSRGTPRPKVFPLGEADQVYPESDEQIAHAIDSNYHKGWLDNQQRTMVIHKTGGQTVTIKEDEIGCLQAGGANVRDKTPNIVYVAPTIRAEHHNTADVHYLPGIRRLTPIECERLQGFPDNWTKEGLGKNGDKIIVSDSQRYKCLGNAVTVNVIEAIGRQLLNG